MTSPGLCGVCVNARRIVGRSGSAFWLCELSREDERYEKYPRLPVYRCAGFEADREDGAGSERLRAPGTSGHETEET